MRKYVLFLIVVCIAALGCSSPYDEGRAKKELEKAGLPHKAYEIAQQEAQADKPIGIIKLVEIAVNDKAYGPMLSDVACKELIILLDIKTELWIKTLAHIDLNRVKIFFISGLRIVDELEKGKVKTKKEFRDALLAKFAAMKTTKQEQELIDYITDVLKRYE